MTPTYEEFLKGMTQWSFRYQGVNVVLSHHGHRSGDEYEGCRPHPGTWCYYLIIPEQMFPDRWEDFACIRNDRGFEVQGPAWDHGWFDTEITWSSSEPYFDRKLKRQFDAAKVGCDYNHYCHDLAGYIDTYASVKADAEHTVRKFIDANPDRKVQSEYSNTWGKPSEFYTAVNGRLVHERDVIGPDMTGWWPADAEAQS